MKTKSVVTKILFILSFSIFTNLHAANSVLEKVAVMMNKQLPVVTSSGESEQYKVEVENDTLVFYYKFYGVKKSEVDINKEASRVLYNNLRTGYCAQPYDHFQKDDLKWKKVYVDSEYKYLFSFKVSKRDC